MGSHQLVVKTEKHICRQHNVYYDTLQELENHKAQVHTPRPWLLQRVQAGKPWRRSVEDIDPQDLLPLSKILYMIKKYQPGYTLQGILKLRDQALVAFMVLSGGRVTEVTGDPKDQEHKPGLRLSKYHPQGDPAWPFKAASIRGFQPLKQRRKKKLRTIPLPREGELAPFTEIFEAWISNVPTPDSYVFPKASGAIGGEIDWDHGITRQRAFQICNDMIGHGPHYFRSVCITYYQNKFRDVLDTKDFFKLASIQVLINHYDKSQWEKSADKLKA